MLASLLIYKDWCCFSQKQAQVGTKPRLAFSAFSPLSHACCVSPDCAPHIQTYWVSSSIAAARYAAPMDEASLICTIFTRDDTCTASSPQSRPLPGDRLNSSPHLARVTQPSGKHYRAQRSTAGTFPLRTLPPKSVWRPHASDPAWMSRR